MKKLNLREIFKKLLSLGVAFVVSHTPVMAQGEAEIVEESNDNEYVSEIDNTSIAPMTMAEFKLGVQEAYSYLKQFINYDSMLNDLNSLYYLVNRDYIDIDLENKLIADGTVYETDFSNQKFESFARAYNLINGISEYNQSVIQNISGSIIDLNKINYEKYDLELLNYYLAKINGRNYNIVDAIVDYDNAIGDENIENSIDLDDMCLGYDENIKEYLSKMNNDYDLKDAINEYNESILKDVCNKLIDPSELCFAINDKKLAHDIHVNYIKAYLDGGMADNNYLELLFNQLGNLNAEEKLGNVYELPIGPSWLVRNVTGNGFMQLIRDYLMNHYSNQQLSEYFVVGELNKKQYILRDDKTVEYGCLKDDLEVAVWYFGQGWVIVYDHVNDDIMRSFDTNCSKSK